MRCRKEDENPFNKPKKTFNFTNYFPTKKIFSATIWVGTVCSVLTIMKIQNISPLPMHP